MRGNTTEESERHTTRRRFLGFVGATPTMLAGCAALRSAESPAVAQEGSVETVASGLDIPWGVEFDRETLYFTERPGRLNRLRDGEVETLAGIEGTNATGEGGLLGLALHPDFPNTPSIYLYQTYEDDGTKNRILRYRLADGSVERTSVLLDGIPGASIHDGGRLTFSPDGFLFATCGDAADSRDAQDPELLNGKILRLNPDGSVPVDNPFGNPVFTYGHRNPQGLAFHPETSVLYSTEHGPATDDEINVIESGNNYGWPDGLGPNDNPEFTDPLTSYTPTIAPGSAEFFQDGFYFGTLAGQHLHRVRFGDDGRTITADERLFQDEFGRIRSVLTGPDGLYFTTSNGGDDRILRWSP